MLLKRFHLIKEITNFKHKNDFNLAEEMETMFLSNLWQLSFPWQVSVYQILIINWNKPKLKI